MKWTYIINQKLKAALALGIVFILVLTTNILDRSHFSELQKGFASVYEDRLLAETYIYRFSKILDDKKLIFTEGNSIINTANDSIHALIHDYELTQLTADETFHFAHFKENVNELQRLEELYLVKDRSKNLMIAIKKQHNQLAVDLDNLSAIQLLEGKKIIENSNKIIATSDFTSDLEIGLLIILGLIVQALIFASQSFKPKFSQKSSMN